MYLAKGGAPKKWQVPFQAKPDARCKTLACMLVGWQLQGGLTVRAR